jgi:hypothetical protein
MFHIWRVSQQIRIPCLDYLLIQHLPIGEVNIPQKPLVFVLLLNIKLYLDLSFETPF